MGQFLRAAGKGVLCLALAVAAFAVAAAGWVVAIKAAQRWAG